MWSFLFPLSLSPKVYESTAQIDLDIDGESNLYEADGLFEFENKAEAYLTEVLNSGIDILWLGVAIQDQALVPEDRLSVSAKLSAAYISDIPINLSQLLEMNVDNSELASAVKVQFVSVFFEDVESTTELRILPDDADNTVRDTGLLAATICLSITVVIIASILLYITGGWTACRGCVVNICFEEIIEPEEQIEQKETFPVQTYDDESRSIAESSADGTAATGILGAVSNDENLNPTLDLGIKTPTRSDGKTSNITGLSEYEDSEMGTPMSEMTDRSNNSVALGITSIRKLQVTNDGAEKTNDDDSKRTGGLDQGLSHMILGRFKEEKK